MHTALDWTWQEQSSGSGPHLTMEGVGRTEACLQHQEHVWQIVGVQSISTRQVHVQAGKPWVTVPDWAGSNLLWDKGVWSTDPQVQTWILRLGHLIATHGNCVPRADSPQARLTWQMKAKACLPTHFEQCRNLRMSSLMKFTPKALSLFE